jgi:signal peptide peptidase SppA
MPMHLNIPDSLPITAHVEQYFGAWAMEESRFLGLLQTIEKTDLSSHFAARLPMADVEGASVYEVQDGVAIIPIKGMMTKYGSSLGNATSTIATRRAIRAAVRDQGVNSIVLHIDSPGGTVSGNNELAQEVSSANKIKPVTAYIEDLGASAAYWVASQAGKIYANPTAEVGSIGTYMRVNDMSGMAAQEGVKVHVIRAGKFKGAGTPGTEITSEHLQEWQRNVDQLNEFFINAVSVGRSMQVSQVKDLADGRVHIASDAKTLGLIDDVKSFDEVIDSQAKSERTRKKAETDTPETVADVNNPIAENREEEAAMSDTPKAPAAATYHELEAGCPGADSEFICAQMKVNATLPAAQSAWMVEQNRRIDAAKKETEQEKAKAAKPGVPPVNQHADRKSNTDGADAISQWNAAVKEKVGQGMARKQAISALAKSDPELHAAYIAEYNATYKRPASAR